ncbi:MAG: hypothetical protein IT292_01435 [Deltaproteobacteria bacterium]|nr:hypothetical protein [Deltaproteobacteria bacterium]
MLFGLQTEIASVQRPAKAKEIVYGAVDTVALLNDEIEDVVKKGSGDQGKYRQTKKRIP